jgi:filamentous hemagglutinin
MAIKLQVRRDTLTNWTANQTVVLLEGEIGYVTDTRNMKIGDGTTQWQFLKYQAPFYTGTNSSLATTTLSVDQSNNRVGIGTIAPAEALGVVGKVYVGNQASTGTSGTLGLISTGGLNYIQSGENTSGTSAAPLIIGAIGGGTNWLRVTSGGVGIGVTASPSNTLNIESATPTIRLKDTTNANTAHCLIDANGDDGSIIIAADPTAQGAAASTVSLSVDNTTRLQATTTGVAITGTTTSSGLITASAGLTVPTGQALTVAGTGTVSVPAGSITGAAITTNTLAPSKISNMAAAGVLGATAAGAVTELTTGSGGTAKTALGLGSAAYTNGTDFICALNQVGQIAFVSFLDSGSGTDAGVYTGVTSSSTTGPSGGSNTSAPTYVSFGGTTTWSKPGSGVRYVRPSQGTWTCIQTNNSTASSNTVLSMICIRTS